jgi:predicted nucleotidyltransferase
MFDELLATYREDGTGEKRACWIDAARTYFASGERPAVLEALGDEACVVLHGSTTRNVEDPWSDLDFYLFLDEAPARRFDEHAPSRFVDVTIEGKLGHMNVTTWTDVETAFDRPDLETVYELQHAVAVLDPDERFGPVAERARAAMSAAIGSPR